MDASSVQRWRMASEKAATQNGLITAPQLHGCGIGRSGIEKGVASGRLWRVHVGVYAVGHAAMSRERRWHAAVLAGGDGAVLSHRPAGILWRIYRGELARVEVTISRRGTRRRPGIVFHASPLPEDEVDVRQDIPVTSPSRTAVDLAHALDDPDRVHGMLREMQYRGLFDLDALEAANLRRPNAILTQVVADLSPTESPLEDAFRRKVIRRYELPEPEYQGRTEAGRVDFRWTKARLTVEVYGNHHVNPAMLQTDASRDNVLGLGGDLVLRYLPADIHRRHAQTAAQIRQALERHV
jgi:very-short-patch-repair endonuclease